MKRANANGRRKRAPRFADIAAEAGVSESTVDRVLNERGSVSAGARERVVAAAKRLGITRHLPDVRHGIVHVDVLMPVNDSPFYRRIDLALQRGIASVDRRIVVHRLRVSGRLDDDFTQAILSPPYPRAGLIIAAPSSPSTVAALSSVARSGVPIVTIVSDLPEVARRHYIGIDHYRAGRTAGYQIGKSTGGAGRVLVLPAVRAYLAHEQRVRGCLDELAEFFPECSVEVVSEDTRDDASVCYSLVQRALREKSPLAGIYNTGDGAEGVESALKRAGMLGRVAWVGHEIDDVHRRLLDARVMDLAIDQDPDGQALAALYHLLGMSGDTNAPAPWFSGEFMLFLPPNVRRAAYL